MNWFPANASSYGAEIDNLFLLILWITGIVFFIVEIALVVFLFKYRRRAGRKAEYVHGSTKAEIIWTAIPAAICVFLGVFSQPLWSRIKDSRRIPEGAITYAVTAKQFEWHFRYPGPDGRLDTDDDYEKRNELHVVVDKDYVMRLRSEDVIHSFFIPAFRIKQDAVPGLTIDAWFRPTVPGNYELACAELCGLGHYRMRTRVFVHTQQEFDAWQAGMITPPAPAADSAATTTGRPRT